MSAEDKDKEPAATKRTDGDYALSYIQRAGNGRVFYEAHGHDEKILRFATLCGPYARGYSVRTRRPEGRR